MGPSVRAQFLRRPGAYRSGPGGSDRAAGRGSSGAYDGLVHRCCATAFLWFAVAYAVSEYATLALQMVVLQRVTGIPAFAVLGGIAPAFGASAVMAIVVWATGDTMPIEGPPTGMAALARLGFLVVQGAVVYAAVLLALLGRIAARNLADWRGALGQVHPACGSRAILRLRPGGARHATRRW